MASNPYPQLRTLGPAPKAGAQGNNPMAVNFGQPVPQTVTPKWVNALTGLVGGIGQAVAAPGNALMGNYNQVEIDQNGNVAPFDPRMVGDASNLAGLVTLGAGAAPAEADALNMGIRAFHGSPHDFQQFSVGKIGAGEGNQAFGHGLYFAGSEDVAKGYRNALSQDTGSPGHMYEVQLNVDPSQLIDWDKPLNQQASPVTQALQTAFPQYFSPTVINKYTGLPVEFPQPMTPQDIAQYAQQMDFPIAVPADNMTVKTLLERHDANPAQTAAQLKAAGIPGVQYLDAGSRNAGAGSRNYVMFGDDPISLLRKYGLVPGAICGGALTAQQVMQNQTPQQTNQLMAPVAPPANPLISQIGT
jgi:hypothetical protein